MDGGDVMFRRLFTGLIVLIFALTLSACLQEPVNSTATTAANTSASLTDAVSQATLSRYRPAELREYNGTRLDPAIGPRDNSIGGVRTVDTTKYLLRITGFVASATELTYGDVLALPAVEKLITLYCVEGWEATILWKGVRLADLFEQAGGTGPRANTVIFHAVDGYSTSLPLATILERDLMLAYQSNGLPLPAEMGYPFIVVAEDKWGYKWARWVNWIELSDDPNYRGYWEQLGYSNEGDLED